MKISSLQKALVVLDTLSDNQATGLSISALSKLTGYSSSSVHHMVSTLKDEGYVIQNHDTKKYYLGYKFLTHSRNVLDNMDLRHVASEAIRKLNEKTGEAVFLSILRGNRVLYLDKIHANPGRIPLATDIGFTSEPHASSAGKVLLCELPREHILKIYPEEELTVFGPHTISSRTELFRQLEHIRKCGYAVDDEEYYQGIRCVAAPVRIDGVIKASVNMTGSVFTMSLDTIATTLVPLVKETADRISARLGGY